MTSQRSFLSSITALWALGLAVLVVLTQVGSLTREVINWDESTFMLLGEDLLDGVLPYVERFDNKPPMIFFLFAGWMGMFGETVPAARALGDLSMWIVACMVFGIALRFATPLAAGLAAALYVALHAVEPGFHTTAGLPAMALVMGALWLLLARREAVWALFAAGVLMSLAVLTRTNLAYLALASGIWIACLGLFAAQAARLKWWSALIYGAGGLLPVLVLIAVYARAGALDELKLSVIDVALSYSRQRSVADVFLDHAQRWAHLVRWHPVIFGGYSVLCLWALVSTLPPRSVSEHETVRMDLHDWGFVWVFLLSILWSLLQSGEAFNYYWQQFFPLTAIFTASLFMNPLGAKVLRWGAMAIAVCAVLMALARRADETHLVLMQPGQATAQYDIRAAADVLGARLASGDRVLALENHLILVYLDLPPITRVGAHPSNLTRAPVLDTLAAAGYARADELDYLMESLPEFVVSHGDVFQQFYLRPINDKISTWLIQNYDLFHEASRITLYQRKGLVRP